MIVFNKEIANINSSINILAISHSIEVNASSEDINIDELRGRSIASSPNSLRNPLAHSDLLSVPYMDRIEAQNVDPSWANQTKQKIFHLFYTFSKEGASNIQNKANGSKNTSPLCMKVANNYNQSLNQPCELKLSSISYMIL